MYAVLVAGPFLVAAVLAVGIATEFIRRHQTLIRVAIAVAGLFGVATLALYAVHLTA